MFGNITDLQAPNSTFSNVGGDQYNTHYTTTVIGTGMMTPTELEPSSALMF